MGVPEIEENIIDNLENQNIFDGKTINLIREMKGFRNILVHKYGEIDDKKAFESIEDGLDDIKTIIKEFEELLAKRKNTKWRSFQFGEN